MTACATVADVLALSPNPARLGLDTIRRALHVGTDRARVIRQLAIEHCQQAALAPPAHPLGLSPAEQIAFAEAAA